MATSYKVHCGTNNSGFTIEIIDGTPQDVANLIRERNLSYGHVDIVSSTQTDANIHVIITYVIP